MRRVVSREEIRRKRLKERKQARRDKEMRKMFREGVASRGKTKRSRL